MSNKILTLVLATALTATVLPAATASDAGHTYDESDTITGTVPGVYATSNAHDYTVEGVDAGTTITATVTWDDPNTDINLAVHGPSETCDIAPEEDPECFVGVATSGAACGGASDPALPGETERSVTVTVDEAADYGVSVQARLMAPMASVPYDLTVTVSDAHDGFSGPETTTYLHSAPHCGLVQ